MENEEENLLIELESTLDEIEEKTHLKRDSILKLFFFELYGREKDIDQYFKKHPLSLAWVISVYTPSVLNYSWVEGPGAPIRKVLHDFSTFLDEEKIKNIHYFCSYFLISPSMPMPGKEIKDSILICLLNDPQNPYKIGLINPSLPLGKKVRVQDYDEGIVNSELCTFRKFYSCGCKEIYRINARQLHAYTKEKLKEKFEKYEEKSEVLYKFLEPLYRTYKNFIIRQLGELIGKIIGKRSYVT